MLQSGSEVLVSLRFENYIVLVDPENLDYKLFISCIALFFSAER